MAEFLQQLLNGLSTGAIYALIALGYTMVYGVLRFINFAHSDVFMVGAFGGFYLAKWFPISALATRVAAQLTLLKRAGAKSEVYEAFLYRQLKD